MMACVALVLGIATVGCGGDEAPAPMATDEPSTSTTTEAPLFTKNSSDDATSSGEPASTSTAPDAIPNDAATSGSPTTVDGARTATTTTESMTDVTTVAETVTTTATTTTSTAESPTSTDDVTAATVAIAQDDIDAGILAMKSFIVDLLGDGVGLVYDDIDLDDIELSCVGRAVAAGIPVDGFDDVLFDCLDDDSYETIERASAGVDGP